jgi:hypothetical protein
MKELTLQNHFMKDSIHHAIELKGLDYDFSADDLGSMFYTFRDTTLANAVNHANFHGHGTHQIVSIKIRKRYWLFGGLIIDIVMENPSKIRALENTQHYSGSEADPTTIVDKATFDRLVKWTTEDGYEIDDAIANLDAAKFKWVSHGHLHITYANGVVDKLLVLSNRIIHLNPYVQK